MQVFCWLSVGSLISTRVKFLGLRSGCEKRSWNGSIDSFKNPSACGAGTLLGISFSSFECSYFRILGIVENLYFLTGTTINRPHGVESVLMELSREELALGARYGPFSARGG